MQDQANEPMTPQFMSRVLKPTEQGYSAYECELVAATYRFIQWRHYLEGCLGYSDYRPSTPHSPHVATRSCPGYRPDGSV